MKFTKFTYTQAHTRVSLEMFRCAALSFGRHWTGCVVYSVI